MNWYAKAIIILVAAAAIGGAFWWTYSSGHDAGEAKANAAWQKQKIADQAEYAAALKALRDAKDADLAKLQGQIATAQQGFENKRKEAEREKAKNAAYERGIRDGTIVLRDPGGIDPPGGSGGAAGAATPGSCDGKTEPQPGRLSPRLAEFLFSEAARADGVIEDLEVRLELAIDVLQAYYEMAKACSAGRATPPPAPS